MCYTPSICVFISGRSWYQSHPHSGWDFAWFSSLSELHQNKIWLSSPTFSLLALTSPMFLMSAAD